MANASEINPLPDLRWAILGTAQNVVNIEQIYAVRGMSIKFEVTVFQKAWTCQSDQ
jgi:hypothetical protein